MAPLAGALLARFSLFTLSVQKTHPSRLKTQFAEAEECVKLELSKNWMEFWLANYFQRVPVSVSGPEPCSSLSRVACHITRACGHFRTPATDGFRRAR